MCGAAALVAALFLLTTFPVTGGAKQGDPDRDGYPTVMGDPDPLMADYDYDGLLDGVHEFITQTDPEDSDSNDDETIDALEDSDSGGVPDGAELANGANPEDGGSDDSRLDPPQLLSPLTTFDATVSTSRTTPLEFDWNRGSYNRYFLQFDSTPHFEDPVSKTINITSAATPLQGENVEDIWKDITKLGRVVYWRVVGKNTVTKTETSSMVASFVITGGPSNLTDPDDGGSGALHSPAVIPTFSWSGSFGGYRVFFTGSHKLGSEVIKLPKKGWLNKNSLKPNATNWKKITNLGNVVTWWVVGKDGQGRRGFSRRNELALEGGADNLAVDRPDQEPDTVATFSADQGVAEKYQILFSSMGDFSKPGVRFPGKGWSKARAGRAFSYTPSDTKWQKITALGPEVFWTVKGKVGKKYLTYSDIKTLGRLTYLEVNGYEVATANSTGPSLPSLDFSISDPAGAAPLAAPAAAEYRVILVGRNLMQGKKATDPPEGFHQGLSAWTMPAGMPGMIANLNQPYSVLLIQAKTADGNSFFSQPYLVVPPYLVAPTLDNPGGNVKSGKQYTVSWQPSGTNPGGSVLQYQIQEAKNKKFTRALKTFTVDSLSRNFKHKVGGNTTFYYRARAINAVGHSGWSNIGDKTISGVWRPNYTHSQPTNAAGNNIILDEVNSNNTKGKCTLEGPGWVSICKGPEHICGRGWAGDYHYISFAHASPSGSEKATWKPDFKATGRYEVWVSWWPTHNRASSVNYYVKDNDGEYGPFTVNQQKAAGGLTWVKLGNYYYEKNGPGYVQLRYGGGSIEADAAAFKYLGP
jgi:hypothetical protein